MKKILIVDDDEDDKNLLCDAILNVSSSAYCIWVSDGAHALRLITDPGFNPPDIIFLDFNMPTINGMECLDKIRNQRQYQAVPVIVYTTSKMAPKQFDSSFPGPTVVLCRPDQTADLTKALQEIFRSQHHLLSDL